MGNNVFANGREVSCKAANGKSIGAFPDVCLTPPAPPAGPLPIPYPNTAVASDCSGGSKSVKIGGREAMLKNKSYFKKSTGDEAATKSQGMGVVTHQIRGKAYFASWSMDVQIEGNNAVRHLDLMTHNHGSDPPNSPPWTYADRMELSAGLGECGRERSEVKKKCGKDLSRKPQCPDHGGVEAAEAARTRIKAAAVAALGDPGFKTHPAYVNANNAVSAEYENFARQAQQDECQRALRCFLAPYKSNKPGMRGKSNCCPKQTGHHVVDAASFFGDTRGGRPLPGWGNYSVDAAPCICVEGPDYTTATHGQMHTRQGVVAMRQRNSAKQWSRSQATAAGVKAVQKTYPASQCSTKCIKSQLDRYHDGARTSPNDQPLNAKAPMERDSPSRMAVDAAMARTNLF